LIADYENRLDKEGERAAIEVDALQERISQLEERLTKKEDELKASETAFHKLEKQTAIFISDSGMYLKILLGFLAGTVFGVILGGILSWWKRREIQGKVKDI
ncbi:MAG: hypothetical protein SCK28_09095, partial [Bacillota bacterium]|nr:hypothetical protein [Bacillota bacterium]